MYRRNEPNATKAMRRPLAPIHKAKSMATASAGRLADALEALIRYES